MDIYTALYRKTISEMYLFQRSFKREMRESSRSIQLVVLLLLLLLPILFKWSTIGNKKGGSFSPIFLSCHNQNKMCIRFNAIDMYVCVCVGPLYPLFFYIFFKVPLRNSCRPSSTEHRAPFFFIIVGYTFTGFYCIQNCMLEAVGKKEYPMKEDESLRKNIVGCEKSRAPKRFGYASLYKEKKKIGFHSI